MRIGVAACALLVLCLSQVPKRAEAAPEQPSQDVVPYHRFPAPELEVPPPPGFHEERRPIYGLIIAGALMTSMGVLLVAEGAHEDANAQHFEAQDERENALGYGATFTQLGLAHLVVGVPVLTAGMIVRRRVFVPNRALNVTFVPIISANRVGGVFALRF